MQFQSSAVKPSKITLLKTLFWTYFLLLIFEGALRKWLLPSFSTALLLIRDPVALLILVFRGAAPEGPASAVPLFPVRGAGPR